MKYWITSKIHTSVDIEEMPQVDLFYFQQRCGAFSTGNIRKWHEPIITLKAEIAISDLMCGITACVQEEYRYFKKEQTINRVEIFQAKGKHLPPTQKFLYQG